MDRKQTHELVNHSLNELQMGGDEAGTADPSAWLQSTHFPICMAGFLTVLCLIILFSSLHFTESIYKMCFIAPHSQSFRAVQGFVMLDSQHPGCVFHKNEGRADVLLPGGTSALELQHTGSTADHSIRVWALHVSSQHITDVLWVLKIEKQWP